MSQFIQLDSDDATNTKTLLYESIPLTGAVVTGTYGDENIKNYTHGMFQSVYDYPYLSSSANHIFDITVGYHADSLLSHSLSAQNSKKINIYNQMSMVLLGTSGSSGEIQPFEVDLTLDKSGQALEGFFINLSRLITKDQIKKGTFSMTLGTASYNNVREGESGKTWNNPFSMSGAARTVTIQDISASDTGGTANAHGGDYGVLYNTTMASASNTAEVYPGPVYNNAVGLIFYQAGIVFLSASAFTGSDGAGGLRAPTAFGYSRPGNTYQGLNTSISSASISASCDNLRRRIQNISFNNTTEINSTVYFCRVPHNRCNMSSNPTYLSSSQIRVKNVASDPPVAYITTVGLYNSSQELLAIAKLSEPLRKDPSNEITLRLRLDY